MQYHFYLYVIVINLVIIISKSLDNSNELKDVSHFDKMLAASMPGNLSRILDGNSHTQFRRNSPFPHLVLDDLFPPELLAEIQTEVPDNPDLEEDGICVKGSSETDCYRKYRKIQYLSNFKPATHSLIHYFHSSAFIEFLEKLTGIPHLQSDPSNFGGGVHQTLPGGSLEIHADFNYLKKRSKSLNSTGVLFRRVNAFVYLNPDWKEEYNGCLELWPRDMSRCGQMIAPLLGRFVVFACTDFSYHGHPLPLTCPKGRTRRSIAMYYYNSERPADECIDGQCDKWHTTIFQKRESQCSASQTLP